jgi:RNA polymerase sigma-70 factor (ECF subfamily)
MLSPEESAQTQDTEDSQQDFKLMERIKDGDEEAFRELVELHHCRVIAICVRMLGDHTEAEDLAQQVFIRVWKSAARWEPTAKFTTWLYTITKNLVFNETRRRSRHPTRSLHSSNFEDSEPPQYADESIKAPDTSLLDQEMHEAIERAIQDLPETSRMAIVLRRYQDVSYEEMASILDLTVPAVKSVLFRARTELRESLKAYLNE